MKIWVLSLLISFCISVLCIPSLGYAIEVAPRISDREIIEGLANIRGDIKEIRADIRGDIKEVKADIRRLEDGQKNLGKQFEKRFDIIQWMFGIFITVTMVILGFVLRLLWQMQKRQSMVEASLETQKDELTFIKGLVEKLFPPKGVL